MFAFWFLVFVATLLHVLFFFKQKTAYEMRISDWSSDVCSSDLPDIDAVPPGPEHRCRRARRAVRHIDGLEEPAAGDAEHARLPQDQPGGFRHLLFGVELEDAAAVGGRRVCLDDAGAAYFDDQRGQIGKAHV